MKKHWMRHFITYGLVPASFLGLVIFIIHLGESYFAVAAASVRPIEPAAGAPATFFRVLLSLVVVVATARIIGEIFRRFRQPPVVGEILGGILLGPSVLGQLSVETSKFILPSQVAPLLNTTAQLGVIIYMFLVGLELDVDSIKNMGRSILAVSASSIAVPFLFGLLLALGTYSHLSGAAMSFPAFALFIGVSMSITAFPVLARILKDQNLSQTPMGSFAMSCAALDDITAWCLLAIAVGISQRQWHNAVVTLGLTVSYVVVMFVIFKPFAEKIVPRQKEVGPLTQSLMSVVMVGLLVSALITEAIGIHAVFGAFIFGATIPHGSRLATDLREKLEDFVTVLLLPAFFAYTGMRTQIGLISGLDMWLLTFAVIALASLGKIGGAFVAARWTGFDKSNAAALGVLMNTRGLVELIALNVGLDLKIISPSLFSILVIMALTTTFMTAPLFARITRNHPWTVDGESLKQRIREGS